MYNPNKPQYITLRVGCGACGFYGQAKAEVVGIRLYAKCPNCGAVITAEEVKT